MKIKATSSFQLNSNLDAAIGNSRGVEQFTAMKAKLIIFYARKTFQMKVKHTHPITPPPYAQSFYFRKAPRLIRGKINTYIVGNSDPAAIMVEFGAHPRGGPTQVLRYHPLATGVQMVASGGNGG